MSLDLGTRTRLVPNGRRRSAVAFYAAAGLMFWLSRRWLSGSYAAFVKPVGTTGDDPDGPPPHAGVMPQLIES